MAGDADILGAIDALGTTTWSGIAFRHTSEGRAPLSGEGARQAGGRWNPPGVPAIYLAETLETCIAEFRRMAGGQARGPISFRRTLHRIRVSGLSVLDVSTETAMESVRLTYSDVTSDDRTVCQGIGYLARYLGIEAVLALSATGRGRAIAVFPDVDQAASKLEVIESQPMLRSI
ncbi:MAG: RES family NAD+ phosphorylase [Dehalococcoidia bacterium]